jgi:hypothetical protein
MSMQAKNDHLQNPELVLFRTSTSEVETMLSFFVNLLTKVLNIFNLKSEKLKKKWRIFQLSLVATMNFVFRMKSEERLEAFRKIHRVYPRFLHVDSFGLKMLVVYDPEISRK